MTQVTGSLVNHILAAPSAIEPTVGMAATMLSHSDRSPATVSRVETVKRRGKVIQMLYIRADDYKVVRGTTQDGSAEYAYTPNPDAPQDAYELFPNGWREAGTRGKGRALSLGRRERWYNPEF